MNCPIWLAILLTSVTISVNGAEIKGRIINGQDSEYVAHVAMVSGYNMNYGVFGGGSFVSYTHVVTAGHLIYGMTWWYVDYGGTQIGGLPFVDASMAILHPLFDSQTFGCDIGIVVLDRPVDPARVIPIALPLTVGVYPPLVNDVGRVSSFGFEFDAPDWVMNQRKQTANFSRISDSDCRVLLGDRGNLLTTEDYHYCAIDPNRRASICHGDVGSSMTMEIDGVLTLVGVVSVVTNMCNPDFPVLYTKVYRFADWINAFIP